MIPPYICIDIWTKSDQGWIQGGAKIGYGGGVPLLQRTSSLDQKATPTNQMHSNYLEAFGKKSCYFWFHLECKIQKEMMHCHCGTNNRAPRWTFTDSCKPEVRPGAREESASPAWLAAPAMNARDTTKVYI